MIKIAPSVLSANYLKLGDEVKAAEQAGADFIHIDVMDGQFVPNITVGPFIVEAIRKATSLPLDVHLMIDRPERYVREFVSAGSDYLVVQAEATVHLHRTLQHIKELGAVPGVAINPATHVSVLEYVLEVMGMAVVMSVNPGFGGQGFIRESLRKIAALKSMINARGLSIPIEVDGGVKLDNAKEIAEAGADVLVMGSAFFGSSDYESVVKRLRQEIP